MNIHSMPWRWLTRRRTRKLFDLMAGFVHSQVLLACVRLDLFRALHQAPAHLNDLAHRTGLAPAVLQRLVLSAVALGLLEHRSQGRFGLGPLGVPLAQHEGIAQMIEHNHLLYQDMQDPVQFLNNAWSGGMAEYWPYAHQQAAPVASPQAEVDKFTRYSQLMAASQGFVVQEILSSYFFDEHRCVLDVGAGKGRFVSELAAHAPHLKFKMFDLPPVLALATPRPVLAQARLLEAGHAWAPELAPEGAMTLVLGTLALRRARTRQRTKPRDRRRR